MDISHFLIILCVLAVIMSIPVPAFGKTVNVTDHGAVPNDGKDDVGAIGDAINAASPGDTVYFPAGIYRISGAIAPKSGIKLMGENKDDTIIEFVGATKGTMIALGGVSGVEIASLTLKGNENVVNGIAATSGENHYLHDLVIKDLTAESGFIHGISFAKDAISSVISDNTIQNIAVKSEWGGGIRLSHGSSYNQVLRNTIIDTGRGGIFSDHDAHSNIFRHNSVSGCGKAGYKLGLEVHSGGHKSIVEDNIIDHWLSIAGSNDCAVRRNKISAKDGTYASYGIEVAASSNCIVTDNVVDEGSRLGISVSAGKKDNVYWAYNTMKHATTWAIQMQGEKEGTHYHYFYKNKFLDTVADHPQAAYPNQGHGVRFNGNNSYIILDSNEIKGNGRAGIQFLGEQNSFSFINNTISGNAGVVSGSFTGPDLEFIGNKISGNGDDSVPENKGFAHRKPVADFEFQKAGREVKFTSASSDPDGSIALYFWDFNDGLPNFEENPMHIFPEAGTYRICLIVWDDKGRGARAEKMVTIEE